MHIGELSDTCSWIQFGEIVKIENTRISDQNDVDRGSDYEVRRAAKTRHPD